MRTTRLLVLHALTPVHVGTGRGEGIIDLPVARDCVTEHPLIPGSGVKGPLRALAEEEDPARAHLAFGPPTDRAHEHRSALRFSDARLLLLPVPSDAGTFAWATSPMVLARWARDAAGVVDLPDRLPDPAQGYALAAEDASVRVKRKVVLDGIEYDFAPLDPKWIAALSELVFPEDRRWARMLQQRLVVLSDDAFDELARTGTDVRAHIQINPESGTVKGGALWYEESVPAESVFVSVVQAVHNGQGEPAEALRTLESVVEGRACFGGGKTTGMGVMRLRLHGGGR